MTIAADPRSFLYRDTLDPEQAQSLGLVGVATAETVPGPAGLDVGVRPSATRSIA